jgi:hypothetical protein
VKALVAAIDRNSAFVGRARDAVSFSPKDLASAHAFLAKERAARKVCCGLSFNDTGGRHLAPPWSDKASQGTRRHVDVAIVCRRPCSSTATC